MFETADEETKEALRELSKSNPGTAMQVAGVLMQQYAPKLDIKVKKINGLVTALDHNDFDKMLAWRRKWLPNESDDSASLARATWLEKEYWENMASVTANGVARAFTSR